MPDNLCSRSGIIEKTVGHTAGTLFELSEFSRPGTNLRKLVEAWAKWRGKNVVRWYKADLHIHTVLSPCADLSMGPRDIVKKAIQNGIDIIAITDHNSCENVQAVKDVAQGAGPVVIPGMEVYSREEAHIICLFRTLAADVEFQNVVYDHLPQRENDPEWFGSQFVVDANEHILRECQKMLAMPTNLHVHDIFSIVTDLGGIAYPAHVDRKSNSLLSTLGFIPHNLPVHALEISKAYEQAAKEHRILRNSTFSLIRSSDAHFIEQFGDKYTLFKMEQPTFQELCMAIKKEKGRKTAFLSACGEQFKDVAVNA